MLSPFNQWLGPFTPVRPPPVGGFLVCVSSATSLFSRLHLHRITTFWNFWKPGNVRVFCNGQENQGKGISRREVTEICTVWDI